MKKRESLLDNGEVVYDTDVGCFFGQTDSMLFGSTITALSFLVSNRKIETVECDIFLYRYIYISLISIDSSHLYRTFD